MASSMPVQHSLHDDSLSYSKPESRCDEIFFRRGVGLLRRRRRQLFRFASSNLFSYFVGVLQLQQCLFLRATMMMMMRMLFFLLLFIGLRMRSLHKKQRVLLVCIVLRIGGGRWVIICVTTMIPYEDNNELTMTAPLGLWWRWWWRLDDGDKPHRVRFVL